MDSMKPASWNLWVEADSLFCGWRNESGMMQDGGEQSIGMTEEEMKD